jgi:hypothetical protein
MYRITVRRQQANAERSISDFVIHGEDAKKVAGHLREFLRVAQGERGKGVWSDADPEVWIDGTFVGRLERDGDIASLVRETMAQVLAGSAGAQARQMRTN